MSENTFSFSSDEVRGCPECEAHLDGSAIADAINHLQGHGYKRIHIGAETKNGPKGEPWHKTVVVFTVPDGAKATNIGAARIERLL
jgi:hypothetical protein